MTRARKTAIRLAWDEETLGAAPRRATISSTLPWPNVSGTRLLSGTMQARILPGAPHSSQRTECAARLLSGVSLVRCQGEEPFHTEHVRLDEDAVLKTAAPAMVSGVRVPGAPPLHSPAWCKSSTLDSQPGNPGASPGAGADFIHPLAQKESGRPTPGRPGSVTSSGDHFHSSVAQKQSNRPITDRPRRDTARRDPRWMAESVNAPG